MVTRVAVLLIHGVNWTENTLSRGHRGMIDMVGKLKETFHHLAPDVDPYSALAFERVQWNADSGLQTREDLLMQKVRGGGIKVGPLRTIVTQLLGDLVAYQPTPKSRTTYDQIHMIVTESMRKLAENGCENSPLLVISHSLGAVIASNYFYDLQKNPYRSESNRLISPQLEIGPSPLEQGRTLLCFFTMGSPLSLWSLRYDHFGKPVKVPHPCYKRENRGLRGGWVNFYDKDDIVGMPLQPLNRTYRRRVIDMEIDVGSVLTSWNPGSHFGYWTDMDVITPIAHTLVETYRYFNQ